MKYIKVAAFVLLCSFFGTRVSAAENIAASPEPKPIDEEPFLYKSVPDIKITTDSGTTHLSALWKEKPILLTYIYAECTGVCTPYLRSFGQALERIGGAGKDYNIVILSFDTTDNRRKMQVMANMAGLSKNLHYILATSDSAGLSQILHATGFWYRRLGNSNQFDHPTEIVAIKDGTIQRILTGNEVAAPRLNEVVLEVKGIYVRSYPLPSDKVLFRCFQLDPQSGVYKPDWGFIVLVLPLLFTILGTFLVFFFNR